MFTIVHSLSIWRRSTFSMSRNEITLSMSFYFCLLIFLPPLPPSVPVQQTGRVPVCARTQKLSAQTSESAWMSQILCCEWKFKITQRFSHVKSVHEPLRWNWIIKKAPRNIHHCDCEFMKHFSWVAAWNVSFAAIKKKNLMDEAGPEFIGLNFFAFPSFLLSSTFVMILIKWPNWWELLADFRCVSFFVLHFHCQTLRLSAFSLRNEPEKVRQIWSQRGKNYWQFVVIGRKLLLFFVWNK